MVAIIACGCRGRPDYVETIVEGRDFAHYIQLPSGFYKGSSKGLFSARYFGLENDHLWFRVRSNSPDTLVVAACNLGETRFSVNSYLVEATHSYSVRPAAADEWESGLLIRDLKTISRGASEFKGRKVPPGFEFNGKIFKARGNWPEARWFTSTEDGSLVIVVGSTKREPGGPARLAIDIYDGVSARRLAGVDVETGIQEEYALIDTQLINSRWVAITLDAELEKALLFDFKPASGH